MATKGLGINLKEDKKSLEQALRELKMLVDPDIERIKAHKYYVPKSKLRREKDKQRMINIKRYSKYS